MNLIADLHVHTIASGHAFSTVSEIASAARKKCLKAIAIADHGPAMPGGAHRYYFWNLKILPEFIDDVRIYKSIEANIIDEQGNIDLDDLIINELDMVIISVHGSCGLDFSDKQTNTEILCKAMKNPKAKILAHPGNPQFIIDKKVIVQAAKDNNIAIEINNSSLLSTSARLGSKENCLLIAQLAAQMNTKVVVTSDAHLASDVGSFNQALEIVKLAKIPDENIINTSLEKVEEFIKSS